MERPDHHLKACIHHCISILELYNRSFCTQRFHKFSNNRNIAHILWLVVGLSGETNSVYCNKRDLKKFTAKIWESKFVWMLSLYDYIYKTFLFLREENSRWKRNCIFNFKKWLRKSVTLSTDILSFFAY